MSAAGKDSGRIPGSGDGWAAGPGGKPAWGRFGAAGLFLLAHNEGGELMVLLQHRAEWTNQGGTWGIPGGARDDGESAVAAAVRETAEECGIRAQDVEVLWSGVTAGPVEAPADSELPGGWTYTTVIARTSTGAPLETDANEESAELAWVPLDSVPELELLHAFGEEFPTLAARARDLYAALP